MGMMQEFGATSTLFGSNAPFIEDLYERYLTDPGSVPAEWRGYFDELRGDAADVAHAPVVASFVELAKNRRVPGAMVDATTMHKQVLVLRLISKYRTLGMFRADLDPLARSTSPTTSPTSTSRPTASPTPTSTRSSTSARTRPARRGCACATSWPRCRKRTPARSASEYMYISDTATKRFFQERLEPIRAPAVVFLRAAAPRPRAADRRRNARALPPHQVRRAEALLGRGRRHHDPDARHADRRRPAPRACGEIVMGMAHRGRLNVLVNILGKMPANLFSEFEGKAAQELPAGDVKYHQGFSSDVSTPGGPVHLTLAFNPSHLEIVNPVVEGSVRARQYRRGDKQGEQVLPILIHGDAAIAGQGVNQECLNMAQTRGYFTGGTIHIVINNQIGFTTSDPRDARGTAVLHRHREDGRGADPPRQRRRSGGCAARGRDRARVPAALPSRRVHRPRLLPPARATTRPTSRR